MTWVTIEEAPNYQINGEGHIRYKGSKRCVKQRVDSATGDIYVTLRIDGRNVRQSLYILQRNNQIAVRRS